MTPQPRGGSRTRRGLDTEGIDGASDDVPAVRAPRGGARRLRSLQQAPLTVQAREAILAAILEGRFEVRLPPEEELADMLDVSRTTVRAAVQDLERDGLVTRRRAIGTVINRHVGFETLALQRLVPFEWLLRKRGHAVTVELSWDRRLPAPEVAGSMPWPADTECCVMDKRFLADGRVAIALRDHVPWAELVSPLREPVEASLFEFSRRRCRRTIVNAVVQLIPMAAGEQAGTALELEDGTPFIRLRETHYDDHGAPVALSLIDLDDRILRWEVFRAQ
jgi:GntR family transcriptional regulator